MTKAFDLKSFVPGSIPSLGGGGYAVSVIWRLTKPKEGAAMLNSKQSGKMHLTHWRKTHKQTGDQTAESVYPSDEDQISQTKHEQELSVVVRRTATLFTCSE